MRRSFQYLQGAIQTRVDAVLSGNFILFQYLQGAIQTQARRAVDAQISAFQYLQGAIQTSHAITPFAWLEDVSIPARCDSDVVGVPITILGVQVSIPARCDSDVHHGSRKKATLPCFNTCKVRFRHALRHAFGIG